MVLGKTRYSRPAVMQTGASKSPVEARADSLQGEYVRHAKTADHMLNGVPADTSGPFCARLAAYGPLRGLVFGYYGEGSGDLHRLIRRIGNAIGLQTGRLEGAPSLHFARAAQINRLYREMSYSVHRDQISYLFHALGLCGSGRRQATRERQQYYRAHAYYDRSAAYYASHFPAPSYTARTPASPWFNS